MRARQLPAVAAPLAFDALLAKFHDYDAVLFAWELALARSLHEALRPVLPGTGRALVVVGPEGGFTHAEAELAARRTAPRCSGSGRAFLRTDTAALALLAVIGVLGVVEARSRMPLPFSIVIPTYNEAAGIEKLLARARRDVRVRTASTARSSSSTTTRPTAPARSSTGSSTDLSGALSAPQRQARAFERRHRRLGHRAARIRGARRDGRRLQPRRQGAAADGQPRWSRASTVWPSAAATFPAAASRTGPARRIITSRVACWLARPLTQREGRDERLLSRPPRRARRRRRSTRSVSRSASK